MSYKGKRARRGSYFLPHQGLAERLEHWSIPEPNSGCLLWLGATNVDGYGRLWWGGKRRVAHQLSWEEKNGPTPVGLLVLHRCDVPGCINVAHLFLGTNADNMADMTRKGRQAKGDANGQAKLGEAQARAIFSASGTKRAIASHFGISPRAVGMIKRKETWVYIHTIAGEPDAQGQG